MAKFISLIHNSTRIQKHHKTIKIISLSIIVISLTACTNIPNLSQLKTNSKALKVAIPANQINPKSQPPAKVENLNFTVPAKYQAKTVYKVEPSNKEKVIVTQ